MNPPSAFVTHGCRTNLSGYTKSTTTVFTDLVGPPQADEGLFSASEKTRFEIGALSRTHKKSRTPRVCQTASRRRGTVNQVPAFDGVRLSRIWAARPDPGQRPKCPRTIVHETRSRLIEPLDLRAASVTLAVYAAM